MSSHAINTLLLVEDNPGDARLLREMFNDEIMFPAKMTQVERMTDAETHLTEHPVDIILLDLGLPDTQGLEAVRRAHLAAPDVPLIVITGSDDESLAAEALREGAQDYLVKGQIEARGLGRAIRYAVERKSTELAERQRDEQYRLLFEGNPNPMWVFDVETLAILAVNSAATQHYGYSLSEFMGMTVRDLWAQDKTQEILSLLALVTEKTTPMGSSGMLKHQKKNGDIIEVEVAGSPIKFQGRRAHLILANDISEKNNLQAQLFQARKMESLGRLAGGVAHDLNNLMGVVLGYGELALDRLESDNPVRRKVEGMCRAADRAVVIVRQLLAFSRNQIQRPQMLSLNNVVEDMEDLLHRLIGEDIELSITTGPQLGTVKADPGQIEQVIMNLVVNARDAMPQGGRLGIKTANVELCESDSRREMDSLTGPHVMLEVSDSGCGMDAATQAKIFEPFFTTKGPGKGTGLGLATVFGIVKQSWGNISVQSEVGSGTTFKICLPRVEAPAQPQREVKLSGEIPKGLETILLVEDAEPLRDVARRFLEQGGYTVLTAEDGLAALAVSQEHPAFIDLLLTDVVMPGLNGPMLAQRLIFSRPQMRVLYMSGYTDDALGPHGVLEQGIALLEKPFTRGSLLRKLREVLDSNPIMVQDVVAPGLTIG